MSATLTLGDFTQLAGRYSQNRPDYAPSVVRALLGACHQPTESIDAVDTGAGTGIFTRMLAEFGCRSVTAVEPNDEMRRFGENDSQHLDIKWVKGRGEATNLPDGSYDLATMASSFHWVDFDAGMREFHRILRPGGRFAALWNARRIESNPLLLRVEEILKELGPQMKRVSSGRSGITDTLTDKLSACPLFTDVLYLEGRHTIEMSLERYLGAWRSVNDVQVQLGPEKFEEFLNRVTDLLADCPSIACEYLTRAWSVARA